VSLSEIFGLRGFALILPRDFKLRRVRNFGDSKIISQIFERDRNASCQIDERQSPISRRQIFQPDDSHRLSAYDLNDTRSLHGAAECAKNINAESYLAVHTLQQSLAWRVRRMDMTEEEVARQSNRDVIERIDNEIDIVKVSVYHRSPVLQAVDLDRETSRKSQPRNVIAAKPLE